MGILGLVSLITFLLLGVFAAANWGAFTAPISLSLLVTSVQAPLGLVMLVAALVLGFVNLAVAVTWRTSMLMELRRVSRELQAQRDLAERAEVSRVADLRTSVERALGELRGSIEGTSLTTNARIDAVGASLSTALRDAVNGLSASIGEVEDKVDGALRRPDRVEPTPTGRA